MNKEKVYVEDLVPGMFVCELDRPWLDTPFLLQGFLIQTQEQISDLRQYCEYVYVDPLKSTRGMFRQARRASAPAAAREQDTAKLAIPQAAVYEEKTTVQEELNQAKPINNLVNELFVNLREDIRKGEVLDRKKLAGVVADMVDSMIRNPNALLLLSRLKEKDAASYGYSINVAICLVAFGRHLGFSRETLQLLGLGGLLLDIGKVKLSEALLAKKTALSPEEHKVMKTHVQLSVDVLNSTPGTAPEILEMVATHHEREDGSGYPRGLKGNEFGIYGKMAGIVDCYEDLSNNQSFALPVQRDQALQLMHQWRGRFFQDFLVDEFIHCIGLYPVGSLVELNTGEVALIVAHDPRHRLQPKIMLILDPKKKPYPQKNVIDLSAAGGVSGQREIKRSLEYGMYGIDVEEFSHVIS